MKLIDRHPQLIAAAIAATGAFFIVAGLMDLTFLDVEPPGAYFLLGFSAIFLLGGGYFLFKANRGHLEPRGETITDVRKQAIEKMQSTELLSQIAREDPEPEVREKAMERLEEIAS